MERRGGQEASLARRPNQRRWRSSAGLRDPGPSSFAGLGAPLVRPVRAARFCLARFDVSERSARRYSRLGTIVEFRGRMRYRVSTAEPRTARTVLQLLTLLGQSEGPLRALLDHTLGCVWETRSIGFIVLKIAAASIGLQPKSRDDIHHAGKRLRIDRLASRWAARMACGLGQKASSLRHESYESPCRRVSARGGRLRRSSRPV